MADPQGFVIDDELAHAPLRERGWMVATVPWRQDSVPWESFDAVIVRSTWDYHHDPAAFLGVLERIERSGVPLLNPLELIQWNLSKTYLTDLAARGVETVPTLVRDRLAPGDLAPLCEQLGTGEVIVKPVVGANADGLLRCRADDVSSIRAAERAYDHRACLVQPFVSAVQAEGEYSLFYFNGQFSHAIRKIPASGDIRVQEEHGAEIHPATAAPALRTAGDRALQSLGSAPLYARVDLVPAIDDDGYWLMELELIEPSLYLRTSDGAPGRFADAIAARLDG